VLVWVSDEGDQFPAGDAGESMVPGDAMMPGDAIEVFPPMLDEDERERRERFALLRAIQPAGAVFALGWVMAELYDPRRRVSVTARQPPFDPDAQLPQVADLAADPKLVFLAAELAEYLHYFPKLARALRPVTAQANRKKKAVGSENLATAQAAEQADLAAEQAALTAERAQRAGQADGVVQAAAASAAVAAERPYSETQLFAALSALNEAIMDEFADDPERLSAYQLGLSLSDLVWLPSAGAPSVLLGLFGRPQLAAMKTLLNGAGKQLPTGMAAIVSQSLDNWADWVDVNSARIKAPDADSWSPDGIVVRDALRVQGWVWHSVLIADPEVAVSPGMGAWVEAGSSMARAARMTAEVILRRFWPLVLIALAALAGLLYLVISNLSGASQVWASLVTVAVVVGSSGYGLSSGVSSAFDGIGYDIWNAAKVDAAAWNITWLPALTTTTVERLKMERRGVAMPQIRKSLDVL
jgi:hypothetical protein